MRSHMHETGYEICILKACTVSSYKYRMYSTTRAKFGKCTTVVQLYKLMRYVY